MNTTTPTTTPTSKLPKSSRAGILPTDQTSALPRNGLACLSCGVAVDRPKQDRIEVQRVGGPETYSRASRGFPAQVTEVSLARCSECTERRDRADELVTRYRLGPVYGDVATERVDAALAALDLLRIRGDRTAPLTRTPNEVAELVAALSPFGAAASWATRVRGGGAAELCAPRRWAHVPADFIGETAVEYRDYVRRSLELPFPFAPPSDGAPGCLLCGVGTLKFKESDAKAAWGNQFYAHTTSLGGPGRPDPVPGYCCPPCRAAIEAEDGVLGIPAANEALLRHLGFSVLGWRTELKTGVAVAWAALRPGTPPNTKPWEHLDLERLTRNFDRSQNLQRGVAP